MKDWNELSEKEQLLQYISDEHKSAYGFRPRGSYDHMTVVELRAELTHLNEEANRIYDEEQAASEKCADNFEAEIANLIAIGADSRATALKWHLEANNADWDMEHHVWNQGFLFTDRGRALVQELWALQKEAA